MIKAAFFDIDGTLLSFNTHEIPDSSIKALEKLRRSGVKLFIASGRHRVSMDRLEPYMHMFDGIVQVNGGLCTIGDKVVYGVTLKESDVARWLDYIDEHPRSTCFVTDDAVVMNFADEKMAELFNVLAFPVPDVVNLRDYEHKNVYQLMISFAPEENKDVLPMFPDCYAPRWSDLFSDIIPNGVNKQVGIEKVLEYLGLSMDEALAFGDGGNDVEMLGSVGMGIAMGSAPDYVKAVAKRVTDDVDNDGIYNAVEKLYKEGFINTIKSEAMIQEITDQTITDVLSNNKVVLIEIGAPGCGPCKAVKKAMEEIAADFEGKAMLCSGDMGSGEMDDTCMRYRVMSAPTLLFFKDGEMVEKMSGNVKKDAIADKLNSII